MEPSRIILRGMLVTVTSIVTLRSLMSLLQLNVSLLTTKPDFINISVLRQSNFWTTIRQEG